MAGILRRLLHGSATAQDDEVREGHLLAARLRGVERSPDRLERLQHFRQLRRLIDLPILLGRQANARTVGAAALVGTTERRGRRPRGRDELRNGESRREDLRLEGRDVLRIDRLVIDRGNGILPDEMLGRNFGPEIAHARTHVAVRELEPRAGECIGELIRVLKEAPRDFFVGRIESQRQVRRQHGGPDSLRRIVCARHGARACAALWPPLVRARRALGELPLVTEEVLHELVAPLRGHAAPRDLEAARDRIAALARTESALP